MRTQETIIYSHPAMLFLDDSLRRP